MTTLLEKDFRLLLLRKSTLFIYLVIGILFTWQFSSSFSGAYMTILGTLLALSTLSYDDSDNCMAFLFTLPCTRKDYVKEKYLFVYAVSFVSGLIAILIIIAANMVQRLPFTSMTLLEIILSEIPIVLVTGGIMIPFQLKFGPEKARIVLFGIFGVIALFVYAMILIEAVGNPIHSMVNTLDHMNAMPLVLGLVAILALLTVISYLITLRIMEKKEY